MSRDLTPLEKAVNERREREFRALPSKELRRLAYRKRAGLHPSERCGARKDSLLAIQILLERKKKAEKKKTKKHGT